MHSICHRALAKDVKAARVCRTSSIIVENLALFVGIRRCAVIWLVSLYTIELDLVRFGALSLIVAVLVCKSTFAVLAIFSVVSELGLSCSLTPAKGSTFLSGVHFHAGSLIGNLVYLRTIPAEVSDGALVVRVALISIFSVGLAD